MAGKGIVPLPARPGLGAKSLQVKFDELVKDVVASIFNQNVDAQEPINAGLDASFQLSNEAIKLSVAATAAANQALEASSGGSQPVDNPFRGVKTSVQTAILDQFFAWAPAPILPDEFDAKNILPENFDSMNIDPFIFDTRAKNIL